MNLNLYSIASESGREKDSALALKKIQKWKKYKSVEKQEKEIT